MAITSRALLYIFPAVLVCAASSAAQVAVAPAAPRWGDVLTITAKPHMQGDETQRFYEHDQLFVFLHWYRHGLSTMSESRQVRRVLERVQRTFEGARSHDSNQRGDRPR